VAAAKLEVKGLTAGYGETRVIEDLSFHVQAAGRLAVLGRNGVGKTTLLATLAGLTRRFGGRITMGDADISALPTATRALRGLGYVPQTRDVFGTLTVDENLFVGLKGRPRAAIEEAYELFPRLRERRHKLASSLSGGEQQMLSTARSILGRPSVLLLDEPLEGLAPVICDELMVSLSRLVEDGSMTIILVEQQIARALDFSERVLILERGQSVWAGSSADLRTQHEVVDRYLGMSIVT
jgi:branched-chain amino acid transport system ATP-binding protein